MILVSLILNLRYRMRLVVIFLIAFFSNFIVKGQSTSTIDSVANANPLKLIEEGYDFGKIPQGKPVHHSFEVENIGKKAFKLDNVQASCGCTTPQWEKDKLINPGEKATINVGYNAAAEGPFTKTITITYNESQSKYLTIKGEVWKTPAASAPSNNGVIDLKD